MSTGTTLRHMARLKAKAGITVTISRGNQFSELVAVPAKSDATLIGQDGSVNEIVIDDWLIVVTDWKLTDPPTPQKGDEISIDADNKWLVAHPDATKPAFKNFNQLDRPAAAWRVHSMPR